jgi:hypothetical protein
MLLAASLHRPAEDRVAKSDHRLECGDRRLLTTKNLETCYRWQDRDGRRDNVPRSRRLAFRQTFRSRRGLERAKGRSGRSRTRSPAASPILLGGGAGKGADLGECAWIGDDVIGGKRDDDGAIIARQRVASPAAIAGPESRRAGSSRTSASAPMAASCSATN